jgi:hypothetical protein
MGEPAAHKNIGVSLENHTTWPLSHVYRQLGADLHCPRQVLGLG